MPGEKGSDPRTESARRTLVAALQLSSQAEVGPNLAACERLVSEAVARGARIVVLPENFAYFGDDAGRGALAERAGDTAAPIQGALSAWARRERVHLVAGGMPERSEDASRPFNTLVCYGPGGDFVASYRKIHLFDVDLADGTKLAESASTTPGKSPVVVEMDGFRVGLSICYDLRFPELYRELVARGAEVLLMPAAFTLHTGKDHWHVLLRARAIEAQCYVAAAAQWGKHPRGRTTYGHALVADPWGTVVAEASDGLGFALGALDSERIDGVRRSLPSLTHRRLVST
ncbi:MAG TPA: carbon-nitrogen hydrolase family protein [Polyangiaceae bacterium]|nr:carbon-nitrogen hydrolase family protein [Polyangiaceae bacterium]